MGNIHTPKTIYSNGLVLDFYVKNKEIFYNLKKWDGSGYNQSLIESAKLGDQKPEEVLKKALHLVGDGIRN